MVVWKHKWQWKNAGGELIQETETPRHVEDGQEVDEHRLLYALLDLDQQILLVQHIGGARAVNGGNSLAGAKPRKGPGV